MVGVDGHGCVGTLLGPETTPVVGCWTRFQDQGREQTADQAVRSDRVGVRMGVLVFWLVFENCTVDASIFVTSY